MSKSITLQTYNEAKAYADLGTLAGTQAAWKVLAKAGDNYADKATDIVNPNSDTFARQLVETTWKRTVGKYTFDRNFNNVANFHVAGYLATMVKDGSFTGELPNTTKIEESYKLALEEYGVSTNASVDALINSLDPD